MTTLNIKNSNSSTDNDNNDSNEMYEYFLLKWDPSLGEFSPKWEETPLDPNATCCVLEIGKTYIGSCSVVNKGKEANFAYAYNGWKKPSFLILLPEGSKCISMGGDAHNVGEFKVVPV